MNEAYTEEQKKFLLNLVRNTIREKLERSSGHTKTSETPEWLKTKQAGPPHEDSV